MAAVPVTIYGMLYPAEKGVKPSMVTLTGIQWNPTLSIGGGPIIPPPELPDVKPPEPPLVIWGGGNEPFPTPPIVIDPPVPPENPPTTPEKPHEGWNWSAEKSGWYYIYVPGPGQAQPKK